MRLLSTGPSWRSVSQHPAGNRSECLCGAGICQLREIFLANKELAHKLAELEHKVGKHDETIRALVVAIRQLMATPEPKKRKIGYISMKDEL
jgi:hypothetical protein